MSRTRYPHRLTALLAGTAGIALGAFEADAVESQAEIQIERNAVVPEPAL